MTNKKNTPLNSRDRRLRFSIRKFNVGVASVAVAAFFLVNGQTVAANDGTSQAGLSSNSQESPALVSSPQDEAQEGIHQTDPAPQEAPAYFSNKEMEAVVKDLEAFSENESSFNSSSTGSLQGAAGPSQEADPLESKPLAAPGVNATDNQGTWEIPNPEKTANSNLEEAAKQADLDPTNHLPLEGFAFDPNPDLQTSFILNLQGARGLETAEDVNVRHNKDYYITFSLPKNPEAPKLLHANLVSKSEGILETKLMAPEEIVTFEKLTAVHPHEYQMIYSTGNDGNQSLSVVYQGRPGPRVSIAYDRISPKAKDVVLAGVRVGLAGSTTQSTSYVVKATGELLAKYTRQGTMGDRFAAAGPVNFDNYELITEELPKNTTGILATDYQVGSKNAMSLKNVKRMYEIVKPDGTAVITIWHLNPDSPNVNELYDINDTRTDNLSDYILMFTSEPVAPGAFNTRAATYKETRTNQNGQTYTVTGETFDMSKMVPGSGLHGGFRVPPINIPSPRREQFRLGGGATLQFRLPNDVMKNEQHVTYYYAQRGDVRVAFVDPSGKEIKPSETLITHGASGTPFNTSSLRHQEIRDQEGQVYHYREILTPPPGQPHQPATGTDERLVEAITTETGLVKVNTIQELTYVYEKAGSVVIHYKNEDGQTIQPSVIDEDKVKPGTSYDTRDEGNKPETLTGSDGNQYHLLRHEGEETGRVESGKTKEITYIYTQAKGTVEITYENTAGETIKPKVIDTSNGKVGDRYDATQGDEKPEKLTGTDGKTYFFKEHKPGTAHPTGVIASGTQTVTYIYEESGSVLIHYKNEEGSTIKPSVLDEDKVKPGTLYNTADEGNKLGSLTGTDKKAYTLHRHEGEESGPVISGKTIEVTYIYRPLAERSTEEDAPQPDQKATTTFIDQRGNDQTELPEYKNVEVGKSEAPLTYSPTSSIDELKKKGYELVSNDYPTDGRFDTDPKVDQNFTVVVTPRIVPVTPEDPKKPTDPVDPEDPNTPVYPEPKDPATPYDKDSLIKEVNRTVTYVYEDGTTASETKTDKVTFRREARVNLVTGDVTYTPWEAVNGDSTFDEIVSPTIAGYTPDQASVPEHANLQHDSEDIVEKVVYVKDGQKAKVEVFVQTDKTDESTKSETPIETTNLTGKSGDPIVYDKDAKLAELEKTGYEVIKNPTIDPTFDNDATKDQNFEIIVTPRIVPVTPEDPKTPGQPVDPDKPNTPVYPEPKDPETPYDKNSLVQEVNRTVTYVYEDGTTASETKTDKVTFRREARVNLVTGDVTYTPWEAVDKDNTFDEIVSPTIAGYTPDQASVPEHANLQHDSEDIVEKVVYVKDAQKAKVEVFIQTDKTDESTKSATPLETTELTGKSGDPIVYDKDTKLAELEKTGYEVIKNPTIDPTFDNDATKDQTFEIVVTPRIVPVTPEDPKKPGEPVDPDKPNTPVYPEPKDPETPYDKDSLVQEVNRTVTYVYEDGTTASETKTDKVTFRREARVNLVTGDVTYTPWEAVDNDSTFDEIVSPAIAGYTPDQASVPEHANLQHDSEDIVEKVVYVKDAQKAKVEVFVQSDKTDESTKSETPIESTELTGKSGDPIVYDKDAKLAELEKKGYEVIQNPTIDPTFDNDTTKDQNFEIVVTPRIVPVTPEDPKKPGEPVDPDKPNTPVYPDPKDPATPYDKDSLIKEVNRTVTYVYEDGTTASETKTDKVTFRREARVNLVTGDVTYTPWEAVNGDNTFDQIDSPVITGYTPDQVAVPEHANLTQDSDDIVEQVVYMKDGQKAKVEVFVQTDKTDESTKSETPIETTELTGKSGDPIVYDKDAKLAELEKTGYEVIKNPTIDPTFDNDATKDQNFEIVVTPRIVPVTPEDPKKPGEPVDPDKPNTPVYPEPKNPETPYDKDSLIKEVNRTVTYVYEDGTTASETKTDKVTFRREARVNLVTGEVTYTPWEAVDGDDTFDQIDSPIITGYIADKANVPTHADLTQDSPDVVEQVVYKKLGSYVPVTPKGDQPWAPIPYPNHPTDPTKPGTPVIPIPVVPDHEPVNPLTPTDGGYEPPLLPEDPTKDTPIPYAQFEQRATTTFIDKRGDESTELPEYKNVEVGKSEAPLTYSPTSSIDELKKKGYELVSNDYPTDGRFDTDPKVDQNFTVVVTPRIVPVTPEDPKKPTDPVDPEDPNTPVYPEPKDPETPYDKNSLVQEVNRTVTYVYEDGTTASETKTDKVSFRREARVNLVTGDVTYTPWEAVNGDDTFDQIDSPAIAGYTPDKVSVPTHADLKHDSEDIVEQVVYVKDGQKAKVEVFVQTDKTDESTKSATPLETTELTGKSGDPIVYDKDTKLAELEKTGYEVIKNPTIDPTFDNDATKDQTFEIVVTPRIVPVTPEDPKKPGEPVDPDKPNTPVYPEPKDPATPYDKDSLIKEVNRTVTYVYEDGTTASETKTDKVTFRREARVNLVTGDVTYTPWEAVNNDNTFDQIDSPIITGYLADKANVPTHADLTQDSPDVVENVVYKKLGSYVPVNPGGDQPWTPIPYPNHPTDPTKPGTPVIPIPLVPDHEPVNPLTPTDGGYEPPLLPEDPTKDTPIPYKPIVKQGTVVVSYVNEAGEAIKPSVVDTPTSPVGTNYDTSEYRIPTFTNEDGTRYVLVPAKVQGSETGKVVEGETKVIYVYAKVANWIPQIPGVPTEEQPKVPYPFDPTNTEKPVDPEQPVVPGGDKPVIPYVPGHSPVNPKDNTPLVPVDPADPTKGYIPPVPESPGVDTPVPYVPVPVTPEKPVVATPEVPVQPVTPQPAAPQPVAPKSAKTTLPNTGDDGSATTLAGTATLISAMTLFACRRRYDD